MTDLQRRVDWEPRLNKFIVEVRDAPFSWGDHDCVTFVVGAVHALTGRDMQEELGIARWTTEEEAEATIEELGGGSLYKALRRALGPGVPGAKGKRGDIAFYDGSCGVIIGRFAMFIGQEGHVFIPISKVQKAFPIGWDVLKNTPPKRGAQEGEIEA